MTKKRHNKILEIAKSVARNEIIANLRQVYKVIHKIEEKISNYEYIEKSIYRIGDLEVNIEQLKCSHENKLYRDDSNLGGYFAICKNCRKVLFKTTDIKEWMAYIEKEEKINEA